MIKSFFTGSMQRLFLCIVLLCILGLILIGGYSSNTMSAVLFEEAEKTSLLQMQRANQEMENLVAKIENMAFQVETYREIYQEPSTPANEMNILLSQAIDAKYVGASFLKTSDGREYSFNPDGIYLDMVQLYLFCSANIDGDRSLKWYNGNNENYVYRYENYFIVCTSLPEGENTYARLFMLVRKEWIDQVLGSLHEKNNVVWLVNNGKLLAVSDSERLKEIAETTMHVWLELYESDLGFYEFQRYDERYITSHFQAPGSEFKFFAVYETRNFYREGYKILAVMVVLIALFCLLITVLYRVIKQQYINPFARLVEQMKKTDYNQPGLYVDDQGSGEVSLLIQQYNEMRQQIHKQLEDICRQEEMKRQAEVEALRYQINPHFFYNTLSNVKLLAMSKGQTEISTTISKFANMYRYLFSNKSNFVKVADELDFIRNYISLMNGRYDNRLNTFYLVDDMAEECKMPVFLLQPIVENAIAHGLSKKLNAKQECFLRISVHLSGDMLSIEVHDDGVGIPPEKVERILSMQQTDRQEFGLGLYNTITRLKYQYGDRYRFSVDTKEGVYTKILLEIPMNM